LLRTSALEKQEHLDNPQKIGATSSTFPSTEQRTISQFIDAFIRDKETNNVGRDFIDALRSQLKRFEAFCTEQRKFYPANITKPDISDFRATGQPVGKSGRLGVR
jgi:site-specific recombinase XerD